MKTKEIGWSYPSSPNARRFGFSRTGCWTVSIAEGNEPAGAVSGHATAVEAVDAADALPYEYSRYSPRRENFTRIADDTEREPLCAQSAFVAATS